MTGLRKWPATAWRTLLDLALSALDEVGPDVRWTFGGGTALALRMHHRVSYDVDIFLKDAADLRGLSPNRNEAARKIANRWQEPGNYVKLEREEGEIDFILAPDVTDLDPWLYGFGDRIIRVEDPAEILAKKLKYRGSTLVPRDVFDILAVNRIDPGSVRRAVECVPDGARRAADRIQRIHERYRRTVADEVNPTASGAEILELDPLLAVAALSA